METVVMMSVEEHASLTSKLLYAQSELTRTKEELAGTQEALGKSVVAVRMINKLVYWDTQSLREDSHYQLLRGCFRGEGKVETVKEVRKTLNMDLFGAKVLVGLAMTLGYCSSSYLWRVNR